MSELRIGLREGRGGRPGLPVPNNPYGLCGRKVTRNSTSELRSCVKVEVDVLGFPSLIVPTVSVDVKQHCTRSLICHSKVVVCGHGLVLTLSLTINETLINMAVSLTVN